MEEFMKVAIEEAKLGLQEGGIPIGSVLVCDGKIIGRGHNRRVQNGDPLAHAEIECIQYHSLLNSYALLPLFRCDSTVWDRKNNSG